MSEESEGKNQERLQPIVIGNAHPFRLLTRAGDEWCASLDDINFRHYDYVKLSRVSAYIDGGIPRWPLGLAFDGSLILPAVPELRSKQRVLEVFNRNLCEALLGGIYCEAVAPANVSYGLLSLDSYFSTHASGRGREAMLHHAIRTRHVGTLDLPTLFDPEKLTAVDFTNAIYAGRKILSRVGSLSPDLLLTGTTFLVQHQWSEALVQLWTCSEQVVSQIWEAKVVAPSKAEAIDGRSALLKDQRTWTTSVKIEVLFQRGLVDEESYNLLMQVRKSRNRFVHDGTVPRAETVRSALKALLRLVSLSITDYQDPTSLEFVLRTVARQEHPPLVKEGGPDGLQPTHYLALPPVPGHLGWGDEEPYEVIEELKLKPISEGEKEGPRNNVERD